MPAARSGTRGAHGRVDNRPTASRASCTSSRPNRESRTLQQKRIIVFASIIAALGIVAVSVRRPSTHPRRTVTAPAVDEGSASTTMASGPRHAAATAEEHHDAGASARLLRPESRATALRRDLASDNPATRIAAIEAAVKMTALDALPVLEDFDLKGDPDVAPTVIHAVAILGGSADDATRDRAARKLSSWLRTERSRDGLDALGNTSNLIEALGNIGGPDAVEALTAALDRGDLELHVETLAVTKLAGLGDRRARGAVQRFAARVDALPPTDGLPEELRVEAIAAANNALAIL